MIYAYSCRMKTIYKKTLSCWQKKNGFIYIKVILKGYDDNCQYVSINSLPLLV